MYYMVQTKIDFKKSITDMPASAVNTPMHGIDKTTQLVYYTCYVLMAIFL